MRARRCAKRRKLRESGVMARTFGLKPSERALLVSQKKSVSRLARFFHGSSPDFYKSLGRRFSCGEAGACSACDAAMPSLEELIAHSRRARTKANRPLQPLRSCVVRVATKIGIAALRSQPWRQAFPHQPHNRRRRCALAQTLQGRDAVLPLPVAGKNAARSVVSLIPRSRATTAGVCPLGWAIRGGRSDHILRGRVSRCRNATRKPPDADLGLLRAAAPSPVLR